MRNRTLISLGLLPLAWSSLLLGVSWGQNSSEPTSSAIVSTKTEGNPEGTVEPAKPAKKGENSDDSIVVDPVNLLPEPAPLPRAKATLVGGTVERLDRVRDKVTVHVFGGGRMNVLFDPRTHIYSAGKEATVADLQVGERIYLDTVLDGTTVFARTIRVTGARAIGESQGVVVNYRPDRNELQLRDALSPTPIGIRLTSATRIVQGDREVAAANLLPGTLVSITFTSGGESKNTAREISILAVPGQRFTFTGQVTHVNLSTGLVVLTSSTDHKTYEVYLDPSVAPDENLHAGAMVTVVTDFDGKRYLARNLTIQSQNQ